MKINVKIFLFVLFFLSSASCYALIYEVPFSWNQTIGDLQTIYTEQGDTVYKIARTYELGKDDILNANPGITEFGKLIPNTPIILPTIFILPNTPHEGITISLAEKRLYFYPKDTNLVLTEPISIGREGWNTPLGKTLIIEKITNPEWVAPDSIIDYSADKGIKLSKVEKPGPDNPLGQFALRLQDGGILIHGTNDPMMIGKRISSGCIRMYPEDIAMLFQKVDKNTPVYIIDDAFKIGWKNNLLFLEVSPPLSENNETPESTRQKVHDLINKATNGDTGQIHWAIVDQITRQKMGIPQVIN